MTFKVQPNLLKMQKNWLMSNLARIKTMKIMQAFWNNKSKLQLKGGKVGKLHRNAGLWQLELCPKPGRKKEPKPRLDTDIPGSASASRRRSFADKFSTILTPTRLRGKWMVFICDMKC
jgi:hypothetical protein